MRSSLPYLRSRFLALFMAASSLSAVHSNSVYSGECCSQDLWDRNSYCDLGFFVDAEVLAWKLVDPDVILGTRTVRSVGIGVVANESRTLFLDTDWDAGVRLGVGMGLPCNDLELQFFWTHFDTVAKGEVVEPIASTGTVVREFTPALGLAFLNPVVSPYAAAAQWQFKFDRWDLDVAYPISLGCSIEARPFLGVTAVHIRHQYLLAVAGVVATTPEAEAADLHCAYVAGGVHLGSDFEYCFDYGLSLYGTGGASVVVGREEGNVDVVRTNGVTAVATSLPDNINRAIVITDLGLGIRWRNPLMYNRWGVTLAAGWEFHYLFNQASFEQSNNLALSQDVGLNGFTLSMKVDF